MLLISKCTRIYPFTLALLIVSKKVVSGQHGIVHTVIDTDSLVGGSHQGEGQLLLRHAAPNGLYHEREESAVMAVALIYSRTG